MKKKQNRNDLVAEALRQQAYFFLDHQEHVSVEQGKTLDRALRSCKAISGHDTVWVRWCYYGVTNGWLTENELKINNKSGYYYPEK